MTQVGALILLPEVAHEWSTLLTVIMQAILLRKLAVGEDHPAVITFDMALYEKLVKILDARPDLTQTVVPRLDELHGSPQSSWCMHGEPAHRWYLGGR